MPATTHSRGLRRVVIFMAFAALAGWVVLRPDTFFAQGDTRLQFLLAIALAVAILSRDRPDPTPAAPHAAAAVALPAALLTLVGVIFEIGLFGWLGLCLLCAAALHWGLPARLRRNVLPAAWILYWAHPLPSQVFGPLQLAMQWLSTHGTEALLHTLNVRAWADGLSLVTGFNTYEVPAWCSGSRTAVTVVLLAMAIAILRGWRVFHGFLFTIAAALQALFLNILRIALLVVLTHGDADPAWFGFLHDTTGLVLLATVFVIYVESLMLETLRTRQRLLHTTPNWQFVLRLSDVPTFWRALFRHQAAVALLLLAAVLAGFIAFKLRPYHRAHLYMDVALNLRDAGHLEQAQLLADRAAALHDDDTGWRVQRVGIAILRTRYEEALARIDAIPAVGEGEQAQLDILRAYALMGLRRADEAASVVRRLPAEYLDKDARVAMILAELAFFSGDPDGVARHLPLASTWEPNRDRIRLLFPYLRHHRRWEAIVRSDGAAPHRNYASAYSAVEAAMNLNEVPRVIALARQAMAAWPADLRTLEPLFFLAAKLDEPEWEAAFGRHLHLCLARTEDVDPLVPLFDKCFALARPDLAWSVYRRIDRLDPQHPALAMAVVLHGDQWYIFRRRFLLFSAVRRDERIDLRATVALLARTAPFRAFFAHIPLRNELAAADVTHTRQAALARALAQFGLRFKAGTLSPAMCYEYIRALELDNRAVDARLVLDELSRRDPQLAPRNRVLLSEMQERDADWQSVYETLRGYEDLAPETTHLPALLRRARSFDELRLGPAALALARQAWLRFPHAAGALALHAAMLLRHDSAEEALHLLSGPRTRSSRQADLVERDALLATARYREAAEFSRAAMLPPTPPPGVQPHFLPPAELAGLWQHVSLPTWQQFSNNCAVLRANLPLCTTPFLRDLTAAWIRCFEGNMAPDLCRPADWMRLGRDGFEQALALNQLTLLLLRAGRRPDARTAAGLAVKHAPDVPVYWRILLGLSAADRDALAAAARHCPWDSEIWLAGFVADGQQALDVAGTPPPPGVRRLPADPPAALRGWADEATRSFPSNRNYTATACARAAEYLLRARLPVPAARLARSAADRARGSLPVLVTALKCAVLTGDRDWARSLVRDALAAAADPVPVFYQQLLALELGQPGAESDPDVIVALKRMREAEPQDPLWAQMLGFVRFQRGGWETVDALNQMEAALAAGATNRGPHLIAAEAARLLGNPDRAAELLRAALQRFPGDPECLNNLAYVLAQQTSTVAEAVAMLPDLEPLADGRPNVMDTLATVHLRAGRLGAARDHAARLLAHTSEGTPLWFRGGVHLAEIALAEGSAQAAEFHLRTVLGNARAAGDLDVIRASKLLAQIEQQRADQVLLQKAGFELPAP